MTTPEIASTMAQRLHFNTFGGNPVCCAGGREVLRVIDDEGIQANAHAVRPPWNPETYPLQRVIDDEGIQANTHAVGCVHAATLSPAS